MISEFSKSKVNVRLDWILSMIEHFGGGTGQYPPFAPAATNYINKQSLVGI